MWLNLKSDLQHINEDVNCYAIDIHSTWHNLGLSHKSLQNICVEFFRLYIRQIKFEYEYEILNVHLFGFHNLSLVDVYIKYDTLSKSIISEQSNGPQACNKYDINLSMTLEP